MKLRLTLLASSYLFLCGNAFPSRTGLAHSLCSLGCKSKTCLASTSSGTSIPWTTIDGEFDQDKDWSWVYTSVSDDAISSFQCENVEGRIPEDLSGTFYRAGPGKFERNGRRYAHVLDGDGFLAAFDFYKGKVKYHGRFVETEFFKKEEEVDNILYRNVFGTQREGGFLANAFDMSLKNLANTNVIEWGGRLFVFWEGGRPYELNPTTLETFPQADNGPFVNLGGPDCKVRGVSIDNQGLLDKTMKFGRFFCAHPHIEGDKLHAFKAAQNARTKEIEMEFVEYDENWVECTNQVYNIPDCAAPPHDFSLNDNYYAFFQNSLELDQLPFILGIKAPTQAMQLQLKKSAILHIVPRSFKQKAVRVSVPSYFNVHMVPKIEEEGNILTVYSNGWDFSDSDYFPPDLKSIPFLGSWSGKYPDFTTSVPRALFYKTTVDLEKECLLSHEEVVPGIVMEWPMQDDRYLYFGLSSTNYSNVPNTGVCRMDANKREINVWYAEPKIFVGEPYPVPKRNGERGSWLIVLFSDALKKRTSLAVLDGERVEDGPVGRVHLPHHVSYGLHGFFCSK